jgi:hypothetical protein
MPTSYTQAQELASKADRLIHSMESLAQQSGVKIAAVEERQRKQRRIITAVLISFLMDIVVTVLIAVGAANLSNTQNSVKDLQGNQGDQLCSLYTIFINADTPAQKKVAEKSGQDLKYRRVAFDQIRESYRKLDCEPPLNANGDLSLTGKDK